MFVDVDLRILKRLSTSPRQITEFCRRWKIAELGLFGSVLRDDFHPDSDIDVLITFESYSTLTLFDWVGIKDELQVLFKREVDIADKKGLKNPYRRHEILNTCQVIYSNERS